MRRSTKIIILAIALVIAAVLLMAAYYLFPTLKSLIIDLATILTVFGFLLTIILPWLSKKKEEIPEEKKSGGHSLTSGWIMLEEKKSSAFCFLMTSTI